MEPSSPTLEGKILTTGPQGSPETQNFKSQKSTQLCLETWYISRVCSFSLPLKRLFHTSSFSSPIYTYPIYNIFTNIRNTKKCNKQEVLHLPATKSANPPAWSLLRFLPSLQLEQRGRVYFHPGPVPSWLHCPLKSCQDSAPSGYPISFLNHLSPLRSLTNTRICLNNACLKRKPSLEPYTFF